MSNRTLIEINHDFAHRVKESPEEFSQKLYRYLASASAENAADLRQFGIVRIGMRHHSEGFDIKYGCYKAAETETR